MFNDQNQPQNGTKATDEETLRILNRAQRLVLIGMILCPASVFLPGGLFISIAGIVCAAIALYRLSQLRKGDTPFMKVIKQIGVMAIICLVACSMALLLNIAAIVIMLPIVLNAAETGDFSALGLDGNPFAPQSGSSGEEGSKGNLTWG